QNRLQDRPSLWALARHTPRGYRPVNGGRSPCPGHGTSAGSLPSANAGSAPERPQARCASSGLDSAATRLLESAFESHSPSRRGGRILSRPERNGLSRIFGAIRLRTGGIL